MTLLGLYRDPIVARMTSASDWRIADLLGAERPVSLYLVVPPSDISRTRPLVRLILNQIGRRLTERYDAHHAAADARQLLFMLDEFPALGRLDFFESALAYLAAYRVRAFLVAQSLHQIDKAYGHNHSILDNCHVRVAFTPNDERTAKRLSDTLGTSTQLRAQRNLSGRRLSAWLSHMTVSEQETPRPLLTPGEILQLPAGDALVMVSGRPPIRAARLRYYADHNFLARRLAAPALVPDRYHDAPPRARRRLVRHQERRASQAAQGLVRAGDGRGGPAAHAGACPGAHPLEDPARPAQRPAAVRRARGPSPRGTWPPMRARRSATTT